MRIQFITTLVSLVAITGCSGSNSFQPDPAGTLPSSGNITIRNHGLDAPVTFVNIVASNDLTPDFETNVLDAPVLPGASTTISSDLCSDADPVDWRVSSGSDFVYARSDQSFRCGEVLDIFVNPDPFVAPEEERGILVFINNATRQDHVLLGVELRRSGIVGDEFGPGRLADGEVLLPGDDTDFDATPCDIAYDIRLLDVAGAVIDVLDNTFIQCDFETEFELVDEDF